jgi:hypothetical protein
MGLLVMFLAGDYWEARFSGCSGRRRLTWRRSDGSLIWRWSSRLHEWQGPLLGGDREMEGRCASCCFCRYPTSGQSQRKIQGDSIGEVSASASAECRKAMNDVSTIAMMMICIISRKTSGCHARHLVHYRDRFHYTIIYCCL